MKPLLCVTDLHITFTTNSAEVQAVRGVSFSLGAGEAIALVGESGCGKSVTAQSIMKLIPTPPGRYNAGKIMFAGDDLLTMKESALEEIRGRYISMIFQDPMTSLNPTMKVGKQITEVLRKHTALPAAQLKQSAVDMLSTVGLPDPATLFSQYPHQLSGGMRQRVMIGMALACKPRLLIADEPTTALDVTVQAQILELLREFKKKKGISVILITHDLAVVAGFASRVLVMYAGKVVESGPTGKILNSPFHPYTRGLLASVPGPGRRSETKLVPIHGQPPDLTDPPRGCAFWPRCGKAMFICRQSPPPETALSMEHTVSCWLTHRYAPRGNEKHE